MLTLILTKEQQFSKYTWEKIRQINTKNYYFYNDQINLKGFDASMLKID